MNTILVATGETIDSNEYATASAPEMSWFFDRPFIQHVIEYLAQIGRTAVDIVVCRDADKIESLIGDGRRWGIKIRYHLAKDPEHPFAAGYIDGDNDELTLVAHATRLPQITQSQLDNASGTRLFTTTDAKKSMTKDTGWALLDKHIFTQLPKDLNIHDLGAFVRENFGGKFEETTTSTLLNIDDSNSLLQSLNLVLNKTFEGLMLTGTEVEPGIRIARNVSIRPTARITPPVFIGENVRIDKGVRLGPNVVVATDCILAENCAVENSMILPHSYVGEALELADVIIDRNKLINARMNTAVTVTDDFILANLKSNAGGQVVLNFGRRVAATIMLVMLAPIFMLTWVMMKLQRRGAKALHAKNVVALPAGESPDFWQTFRDWRFDCFPKNGETEKRQHASAVRFLLLRFIPGLLGIIFGRLAFVGVQPRSPEAILNLPRDWRELYLKSKPGLITELDANGPDTPTNDDIYSAEAFYAVKSSLTYDIKLIFKTFVRLLKK